MIENKFLPPRYLELYKKAINSPEEFWKEVIEVSSKDIYWARKPERIFEWEYPKPFRWFIGGYTNAGYSAVDYKVNRCPNKIAYIYVNPEIGIERKITYKEFYEVVNRFSASLRALGVGKGDTVLVYMPNTIEAVASIIATARTGAVSSTVFAGFAPKAIADRIDLVRPKVIFTQDYNIRRGKLINLKQNIDDALKLSEWKDVKVVVTRRLSDKPEPNMERSRDMYLEEFLEVGKSYDASPIFVESNEPLLIMPTSGTTAKPKPVTHMHGGYQVWIWFAGKIVYGLEESDIVFNTSDIGWIVGQSYIIFDPLINACTSILFDGAIDSPKPDIFWEIVEKYKPSLISTSPTAVRMLYKLGKDKAKAHDLSSVRRVLVAGEVLNPEVWKWLYYEIFDAKIPVIDHMWQTETSGPLFGYPYSLVRDIGIGLEVLPIKPGSAGIPMPGVEFEIVNEKGEVQHEENAGIVVIKRPFPGLTPTLWNDHERYLKDYWGRIEGKRVYYTGDAAKVDKDGYIFFLGRADEVIKIAGHRIGTIEVESALLTHPAVAEAAAVGVPDPIRGEALALFITLKPNYKPSQELEKELIEHLRKTFGPIAVVAGISFMNMLPKTRSGKIMRRVLKRLWTGEPLGDISTIEDEASIEEIKEVLKNIKKLELK
ncbi:MAG: AMP-binding protein [Sulfolobaceae archaeon]